MAIELRNVDGEGGGEGSRYEILVDGRVAGLAEYRVRGAGPGGGQVVVLPHTEVSPAHRGQGIGERLVRYALDDLRSQGATVLPQCWYVARFIDEHPEYQDLVAA